MERKGFHPKEFFQHQVQRVQTKIDKALSKEYRAYTVEDFAKLIKKYGSGKDDRKFFRRHAHPRQVDVYTEVIHSPYANFFELNVYPNRRDRIIYFESAPMQQRRHLLDLAKTHHQQQQVRRESLAQIGKEPWVEPKVKQIQKAGKNIFNELTALFTLADKGMDVYDQAKRTAIERGVNLTTALSNLYKRRQKPTISLFFGKDRKNEEHFYFGNGRPDGIEWIDAAKLAKSLQSVTPWPIKQ